MSGFGDDAGPADQFDDSRPDVDPEAVTIRFHEERVIRGYSPLGYWHELTEDERGIARLIGYFVVEEIFLHASAERIAQRLGALREYLGAHFAKNVSAEDRIVIQAIITMLRNEGTLR